METIIHIGQHKTGTTSLQKFLFQYSPQLRKQKYYYTNKILTFVNNSHYILNVYALDRNRYSSMKERIIDAKGINYIQEINDQLPAEIKTIYDEAIRRNCNKVIWSNEGLFLLNSKKEYKRLYDLFKPFSSKIIVVCCFRDIVSYKVSYSLQLQKQGIAFSNDPDSYKYLEKDSWLFDYERKKNILSDVFDQCLFWDYDKEDNTRKFLQLLNIDIKGKTNMRLNVTENHSDKKSSLPFVFDKIITRARMYMKAIKRILHSP